MASLESLTDGELRTELSKLGFPVGPITSTTRKVLLKKLKHLLEQSKTTVDGRSNRSSSRFSSGDESEEDPESIASTRRSMPPPKKAPPAKSTRRRSSGRTSGISPGGDDVLNLSSISNFSGNNVSTSSPEKSKYSPPSFSDNFLKGPRSSGTLFSSLTGRRSFRPEVENTSYNLSRSIPTVTGLSPADEGETTSNLSNFANTNRFARGEESFSRSLGLSSGLTTSYVPADNFKHRFLSTKTTVDDISGSNLGNDGFENSYSDINRRFGRVSQPSPFSSRIGNLPSPSSSSSFGLSNVKESDDDEEPMRSSVPPSQYNHRLRYDKWTFDSPWWRNTTLVSMGLLMVFISFFALIFFSYMNVQRKSESIGTSGSNGVNFVICRGSGVKPGVNCIVEDDKPHVIEVFRKVYKELYDHVVRVKCEDSSKSSALTLPQISQRIIDNNSEMSIWDIEQQYANLKLLIKSNPQFGVVLSKDGQSLDIQDPSLPFSCLIKHNVLIVVWFILRLILCGLLLYSGKRGFNWWLLRKEEHKKEVFKLVEAILELLQTHSQNCGDRDTFLALDHVRDQLIPPHQRCNLADVWDDAVSYIESQESRVRTEVQQVAGEDCHVWRWLPTNSRRKMWQGQAFETQEGSVNSLNVSPTPCLKIRHMFDPDIEVGDEWMTHVKDAILEKCEGINVLHIAVDKGSLEGCVYLKCSSPEEAGKAFRALHGSWFDSKLVTVKYLRLGRYHERFPDSVCSTRPLRPSNNHRMSMQ